jgi:hypothetical protein
MRSGKIFRIASVALAAAFVAAAAPVSSRSGESRSGAPVKGGWDFAPVQVWSFGLAGNDTLRHVAEPRISGDGRLYLHDFDRHLSYIIDENGTLVGRFAQAGEGPGEVSRYVNCFTSGDRVIVGSMDKLYFFDRNGLFVKSIPNNIFESFPLAFTGDDIMYAGPGALVNLPDGKAAIRKIDIASGQAAIIHEFTMGADERINFGGVIIGLIPQINMAFDAKKGTLYFGRSDRYEIQEADKDGKIKGSFGLAKERTPVTEEELRGHFAGTGFPADRVEKIIPLLPRKLTYFHRIQVVDGLVYVFTVDSLKSGIGRQYIDIFSRGGEYLYRGKIALPEGDRYRNLDQISLSNGFLHAILANEDGTSRITKYRISMPDSR